MRRITVLLFVLVTCLGLAAPGSAQLLPARDASAPGHGSSARSQAARHSPTVLSPLADFNGDGFADQAIGVPFDDIGEQVTVGKVNILYGTAGGLQATAPDDQVFSQDTPGMNETARQGARFGAALSWGDYNGDGFTDLAIDTPRINSNSVKQVGQVDIIYGSSAGLQLTSPPHQKWTESSPGMPTTPAGTDFFGAALGSADFNADGFADLVIGTPLKNAGGRDDSGAMVVLYGTAGGLQTNSPAAQYWNQDSPNTRDATWVYDRFSSSLAPGDFNGDAFADLAIGLPHEADQHVTDGGSVDVYYGSATGLQVSNPDDQAFTQEVAGVPDQAEAGDQFGLALAAGDFNDDGFDDLGIGVPGEWLANTEYYSGGLNVLYGSPDGLQTNSPASQFWVQESPGIPNSSAGFDFLAAALAAADFDRDGFADLAIGIPGKEVGGALNAGSVDVLYGSPSGLQTDDPVAQEWTQDTPNVIDGAGDYDHFGFTLAVDDYNDDDYADLVIGVPGETVSSQIWGGGINVLYGSGSGLQTNSPPTQFWSQDSASVKDSAGFANQFSYSLFNGALDVSAGGLWLPGEPIVPE